MIRTPPGRRGFTLIELLVVTVLGSIVLLAAVQILITNQRTYTAQNAVIQNQQNARMALDVLFNDLRELSPSGGDILEMGPDEIRVRLMRKFSVVCDWNIGGGDPEIFVFNFPGRRFEPGDSVFVFADNDPNDDDDDAWISAAVSEVDTDQSCPQNDESASRLRFGGQEALFVANAVGVGAPVRSFERFEFGPTVFRGDTYLGRNSVPVVGPIRPDDGLAFVYRDAMGDVTNTPADVRQIVTTVRTGGGVLNSLGTEVRDSITFWIYTRN
jgi:prepilin-type N-terminal cleavage/methylation domain-containing protein